MGTGPIGAQPGTDRRMVAGRSGKFDLSPFFQLQKIGVGDRFGVGCKRSNPLRSFYLFVRLLGYQTGSREWNEPLSEQELDAVSR